MALADAEGLHASRRQDQTIRGGKAGQVRRSPQARGRQEERRRRTWEAPEAPGSGSLGGWETALEARKGTPGDGTMLEPQRRGGKRDRQAEESWQRERPPEADG